MKTEYKISGNKLIRIHALLSQNSILNLVAKLSSKYYCWSDIKLKKLPKEIKTHEDLWGCIKLLRAMYMQVVWSKYDITMSVTDNMKDICHQFDIFLRGSIDDYSSIFRTNMDKHLVSPLMEEAIFSSLIDGATTSLEKAKEMLVNEILPNNNSEWMIYNNYKVLQFITDHGKTKITPKLILHIHDLMKIGVENRSPSTKYYRKTNNINARDTATLEAHPSLPDYKEIPQFIKDICIFINNEDNDKQYIHPLIKGIIIHFMIDYVHPFPDNNRRIARALFYYYMLKEGYWLAEYISISKEIYKSIIKYDNAYLSTKHDENDLGYFITYHLELMQLAFEEFKAYVKKRQQQKHKILTFINAGKFNKRQISIIQTISELPNITLTINSLRKRFAISHTTANADVVALAKQGILNHIDITKIKKGYIKGSKFDKINE